MNQYDSKINGVTSYLGTILLKEF